MKLQFIHFVEERESETLESEWFQITYDLVRNDRDEEIALMTDSGHWRHISTGKIYTDLLMWS
jgi:hypothetical protein